MSKITVFPKQQLMTTPEKELSVKRSAYFYYLPTDIQFAREYESAYRIMQEKMNRETYITFFAEPDAISREVYVEKLKGYLAE